MVGLARSGLVGRFAPPNKSTIEAIGAFHVARTPKRLGSPMDATADLASKSLDDALAAIISRFRAESGTIHFIGPDGALHLAAASRGLPEPVLNMIRVVPVGKGMAGLAAERRTAVTACNIQTDTSGDVRQGAKATGMEGAIVVPTFSGYQVVGTLGIANRAERTFSADEQASLIEAGRTLAARAGEGR
jgi:L-methionine (R)-S-oxide reductase